MWKYSVCMFLGKRIHILTKYYMPLQSELLHTQSIWIINMSIVMSVMPTPALPLFRTYLKKIQGSQMEQFFKGKIFFILKVTPRRMNRACVLKAFRLVQLDTTTWEMLHLLVVASSPLPLPSSSPPYKSNLVGKERRSTVAAACALTWCAGSSCLWAALRCRCCGRVH